MFPKKIYIDPGHVGKGFFDFREFLVENIEFHEGDFCYSWANILKERIAENGLTGHLSRPQGSPSVIMSKYLQQLRAKELVNQIGMDEALRKFRVPLAFFQDIDHEQLLLCAVQNEADLIYRAEYASCGEFDICLSLHLNGDPKKLVTNKNGVFGITNSSSINQYDFFEKIINNLTANLGLPLFDPENLFQVKKGIYVDDSLTLMKNIKIPTLLIEGPFQNNLDELLLLNSSLKKYTSTGIVEGRLEVLARSIAEALCE